MKPRILLTGRNGQVGAELLRLLPSLGDVFAPHRSQMDLAKPADIRRAVRENQPDLIFNAAAYTSVDRAEQDAAAAQAVNAEAPALLAEEAKKSGSVLVHYSTDYVFDGRKDSPYEESDPPNPINVYGKSKLAGERAIRASGVPHLILRTSWIYGRTGRNFLLTILRLATEREELRIVCDQFGAPTWSREIAAATVRVLQQVAGKGIGDPASLSSLSGIYHMTAGGATPWSDFGRSILEESHSISTKPAWFLAVTSGLPLLAQRVIPIPSADYPTPALRPASSVLSNAKLERTFHIQLPDWRAQLHSVFHEELPGAPLA
jgi:dTDP-4-dehydrorhamnose reductase